MNKILRGIKNRKIALISFIVLLILYFLMIFAEFISPYDPNINFQQHSYHPPNLTFYSEKYGLGPQVQERINVDNLNWRYVPIKDQFHKVSLFVKGP